MAERRTLDIAMLGADIAGFAAAALAARLGKSVALIRTGNEPLDLFNVAEPPNFLWRLLELHQHGLDLTPVSACVSLFQNRAPIVFPRNEARAIEAIGAIEKNAAEVWRDFLNETRSIGSLSGVKPAMGRRSKRSSPAPIRPGIHTSAYASADQLLDDYFSSERVKTHIASQTYARFGLGGDEAGGVAALRGAAEVWPLTRSSAEALSTVFENLCSGIGVRVFHGPITSCVKGRTGASVIEFANGESVNVKSVCASSALNAEASGFKIAREVPPLRRRHGVEAVVNLHYNTPPSILGAPDAALYFIASSRAAVRRARNEMIEGGIPDELPLIFEINGDVINVGIQYCPSLIRDGDSVREWSGQDKQALGRQAASQIGNFLSQDCGPPAKMTVQLGADAANGGRRLMEGAPLVAAPPPSLDSVSAAANLVMEMLNHE